MRNTCLVTLIGFAGVAISALAMNVSHPTPLTSARAQEILGKQVPVVNCYNHTIDTIECGARLAECCIDEGDGPVCQVHYPNVYIIYPGSGCTTVFTKQTAFTHEVPNGGYYEVQTPCENFGSSGGYRSYYCDGESEGCDPEVLTCATSFTEIQDCGDRKYYEAKEVNSTVVCSS